MTIGAISTAVLAGVIVFLLMLGLKRMARSFHAGICCKAGDLGQSCQGCHGCREHGQPAQRET